MLAWFEIAWLLSWLLLTSVKVSLSVEVLLLVPNSLLENRLLQMRQIPLAPSEPEQPIAKFISGTAVTCRGLGTQ